MNKEARTDWLALLCFITSLFSLSCGGRIEKPLYLTCFLCKTGYFMFTNCYFIVPNSSHFWGKLYMGIYKSTNGLSKFVSD